MRGMVTVPVTLHLGESRHIRDRLMGDLSQSISVLGKGILLEMVCILVLHLKCSSLLCLQTVSFVDLLVSLVCNFFITKVCQRLLKGSRHADIHAHNYTCIVLSTYSQGTHKKLTKLMSVHHAVFPITLYWYVDKEKKNLLCKFN